MNLHINISNGNLVGHTDKNIKKETEVFKDAVNASSKSVIGALNAIKGNLNNCNYNIVNCLCK